MHDAWAALRARWSALDTLRLAEAGEPGRAVLAEVEALRVYLAARFPAAHVGLTRREAARALAQDDLPVLPERVRALFDEADAIAFAAAPVSADAAREAARQARRLATEVQEAHEARVRAAERGPQPWRAR